MFQHINLHSILFVRLDLWLDWCRLCWRFGRSDSKLRTLLRLRTMPSWCRYRLQPIWCLLDGGVWRRLWTLQLYYLVPRWKHLVWRRLPRTWYWIFGFLGWLETSRYRNCHTRTSAELQQHYTVNFLNILSSRWPRVPKWTWITYGCIQKWANASSKPWWSPSFYLGAFRPNYWLCWRCNLNIHRSSSSKHQQRHWHVLYSSYSKLNQLVH